MFYEDDESINAPYNSDETRQIDKELNVFVRDKTGFDAYSELLSASVHDYRNVLMSIIRTFYSEKEVPAVADLSDDMVNKMVNLLMFMFSNVEEMQYDLTVAKKALYDLQTGIFLIDCPAAGNA